VSSKTTACGKHQSMQTATNDRVMELADNVIRVITNILHKESKNTMKRSQNLK
jgi:hypothetical protein